MSARRKCRVSSAEWGLRSSRPRVASCPGGKRKSKTLAGNCWPTSGEFFMSRIGNKSITLPDKVKVNVGNEGAVAVEGPKGKLNWKLPQNISAKVENNHVSLARAAETRSVKALHGLSRALLNNMVRGVSEGFSKDLEIEGVGFKAAVQGQKLNLSLGFSHPILFPIPKEIKIVVTENTKLTISGIDKKLVGQVAADIRRYYPPEPYKGKGVRYAGEQIRRKEGKTVQ